MIDERSCGAVAATGRIDALGGTGALPCWIRLARWVTAAGSAVPTRWVPVGCTAFAFGITGTGRPLASGLTKPGLGRLMFSITRTLCMLVKNTSLRGGRT